jgi:hypothetical protein
MPAAAVQEKPSQHCYGNKHTYRLVFAQILLSSTQNPDDACCAE